MKPIFRGSAAMLARKPAHGAPCTRCGLCCVASLCKVAERAFNRPPLPGPCPALVRVSDTEYGCGIVADPARYLPAQVEAHGLETIRESVSQLIETGTGCDARFNGEPVNHAFNAELELRDVREAAKTRRAMLALGWNRRNVG